MNYFAQMLERTSDELGGTALSALDPDAAEALLRARDLECRLWRSRCPRS